MTAQLATTRSRRTRASLLNAARELIEDQGFAAVTMGAVADQAGVTRRSVYLHFPSRSELVGALFDHVAAAEGLAESLSAVWTAPTAADALRRWAEHLATYHQRLLRVDRAITSVADTDPDAKAHLDRVRREKLRNCRRLAGRLADEHVLAPGWSAGTAADVIYAITTSDVVEALLLDRRWGARRFVDRVSALLQGALVRPAGTASR